MNTDSKPSATPIVDASRALGNTLHDFEKQCMRVLHCTAKAFANSPGGLRFKAGSRPWLEALTPQQVNYFSTQQGA